MKRLWASLILLTFVFSVSLFHQQALHKISHAISNALTQAELMAGFGRWDGAEALTRQAMEEWRTHGDYLYLTLRHTDTDRIVIGFQEVLGFLKSRETGEYFSANARLIAQVELLYEMEQLTLRNLL